MSFYAAVAIKCTLWKDKCDRLKLHNHVYVFSVILHCYISLGDQIEELRLVLKKKKCSAWFLLKLAKIACGRLSSNNFVFSNDLFCTMY